VFRNNIGLFGHYSGLLVLFLHGLDFSVSWELRIVLHQPAGLRHIFALCFPYPSGPSTMSSGLVLR